MANHSRRCEHHTFNHCYSEIIRVDMMTEDIEEIRRKRAADKLAALDSDDIEARKETLDSMPWSFAIQKETGTVEIRLNDDVIALTQDPNWAVMIVELMNRLMLAEEAGVGWP